MAFEVEELSAEQGFREYRNALTIIDDAGLPTRDLAHNGTRLFGYYRRGVIVGAAALEPYDDGVLLRSVAILCCLRGRGYGSEMVERMTRLAADEYGKDLYLLTETAVGFFARFGFTVIKRQRVPRGVASSPEFTHICPSTARAMVKRSNAAGR